MGHNKKNDKSKHHETYIYIQQIHGQLLLSHDLKGFPIQNGSRGFPVPIFAFFFDNMPKTIFNPASR